MTFINMITDITIIGEDMNNSVNRLNFAFTSIDESKRIIAEEVNILIAELEKLKKEVDDGLRKESQD